MNASETCAVRARKNNNVQTPLPLTQTLSEIWSHRTVGMTGVELITITRNGRDQEYLFSLIDGSMNSEAQIEGLAIDAATLITRMDWYREAVPLLVELARHVADRRDGSAFISLPTATESDLCRDLRRLADVAIPPFDPGRPVYAVIGANGLDVAADIATGFHVLCLDAGAAMVRPACSDGFYDEGHGCWRISMQMKDDVTLDAWVRALAALWREAFDDIAMGVEVGDGEQRLLRDDLQDVPATA